MAAAARRHTGRRYVAVAVMVLLLPWVSEAGHQSEALSRSAEGLWLAAGDGGVFSGGAAEFHGSSGATDLNQPVVAIAPTPSGRGYWLVAADGGLFAFGDAGFFGSLAERRPTERVVAMAATPTGRGYHQATETGEVVPFGDATLRLDPLVPNQFVVGMAATGAAGPGPGQSGLPSTSPDPPVPAPPTTSPAGPNPAAPPGPRGRPNVLVLLLDDMRFEGSLEVMPKTVEWFVEGGTTFPDGYATTPLCCPHRASIWSGRYMHNHGVVDNGFGDRLDLDWIIPRYLRDAGYRTALAGKFITDWDAGDDPPYFDRWAVFQGGDRDAYFNVDGHGTRAEWTEPFLAERTIEFLTGFQAEDDDAPWFIQVSPQAPHDGSDGSYESPEPWASAPIPPWEPTPAVFEDTREEKADKVAFLRGSTQSEEHSRYTHEGHMRALMTADAMVDDIMRHLEATGELDNTLAIFTSDNGYHWGERGVTSKGYPYVESVKVPFLVRWDGVFPAGTTDPRLVAGLDILPTALEAAGADPQLRYPLDGRSFLPGVPGREAILLEFHEGHRGIHHWASLRTPQWQYIEWYEDDGTTREWTEHYDLAADPWQLDSVLFDDDPANDPDVAALSARLAAARRCTGTSGAGACP